MVLIRERFRDADDVLADAGEIGGGIDAVDEDLHRLPAGGDEGAVRYRRMVGNTRRRPRKPIAATSANPGGRQHEPSGTRGCERRCRHRVTEVADGEPHPAPLLVRTFVSNARVTQPGARDALRADSGCVASRQATRDSAMRASRYCSKSAATSGWRSANSTVAFR